MEQLPSFNNKSLKGDKILKRAEERTANPNSIFDRQCQRYLHENFQTPGGHVADKTAEVSFSLCLLGRNFGKKNFQKSWRHIFH